MDGVPVKRLHHGLFAWLLLALLLLHAGAARAVNYTFPGNLPPGCSGNAGNYTCTGATLNYGDTFTINSPKPATVTVNGNLSTNTNSVNASGLASDLNLIVTGTLTASYHDVLRANITAGSINDGSGQATFGGSLATTSGAITLAYASTVASSITSTTGTITVGQDNTIGGNVSSTSGAINIGFNATVNGNVSTSGAITVSQDANVNGSITGTTGNVSIGYAATVTGALTTSSGSITLAQNAVASACVKSTSSAAITLGLRSTANSVCCGGGCSNSCVVNNSTYAMPAACAGSGPDHYELSLPTPALVCTPSTVTVTACANSSSPCTSAYTSANGATASLATSAGTLGSGTVSFNASGVATTTLSYPAAGNGATATVTLSGESLSASNARRCCPNGSSCSAANSCTSTFNTAGFIVAASANGSATTLPSQTAGTASGTYYLRAIQTNTTTKACEAALSGSTSVNWAAQCNNPGTCSSGNKMTLTGSSATAIASNPNSGVSSTTAVTMAFDANGNAPFSFNYADVGQVTLWASKTVNSASLSGSSNAFVVKPASFSIAAVQQAASPNLANPAASSAAGAKFVKAGESFSVTVTALTSGGVATPNFGRETSPEGVLLTPSLVLPSGGTAGSLSNGSIAGGSFSGGATTVSTLSYGEVGIITLTPSVASGSYLGAGAVSGTASGNIGRFVPAKFAVSGGSVTHRSGLSCSPASAFSYLGENFRLAFTLTAQNTAGSTTQNYSGSFAKLDPTSASGWNLAGLGGTTAFSTTSGRLSLGSATGSFSAGVASVTLTANASRASSPDGPFTAAFGVAPADSDGVALASYDMASTSGGSNDRAAVASVALRFGRLRLSNAMGAADRVLALPATAQSWTGSAWDTNTLDSCSTVPASAVNFGNLRKTLTLADLSATAAITLSSGVGTLRLAAPAGGRSGTVDVALSLGSSSTDASCLQSWSPTKAATAAGNAAYLRGAWCGSSVDKDPSARASFGLQRTQDHTVYRREMY